MENRLLRQKKCEAAAGALMNKDDQRFQIEDEV